MMFKCCRFYFLVLLVAASFVLACSDTNDDNNNLDGDLEQESDLVEDSDYQTSDGDDDDSDTVDGDSVDGDAIDGDMESQEFEQEVDAQVMCSDEILVRPITVNNDDTFEIGPYLMRPTTNSIIIMWRTETLEDGKVIYGLDDNLDMEVKQDDATNVHELKLSDLQADTKYNYKVISGGVTSQIHHFYTAVKKGQGFNFALWGDNQNGPETFVTVVDQIMSLNPHIVLGVGDHVQEGDIYEQWKTQLFGPARPLFHEVAFFATVGNHEQNGETLYELYSYPAPEDDPQHESYYSFTYGNAFFMIYDTNKPFFPIGTFETNMSKWIKETVASPEAKAATWRFALAHTPALSEAWGDGSCTYDGDKAVDGWVMPLLKENGFHAHFSGHMHGYERGMIDGVVHIISGGGGGHLDAWCVDFEETKVAHYEHNNLFIKLGCNEARIEAIDLDGNVFDWVVLEADKYGQLIDDGPAADLPDPVVNSDSPYYEGD